MTLGWGLLWLVRSDTPLILCACARWFAGLRISTRRSGRSMAANSVSSGARCAGLMVTTVSFVRSSARTSLRHPLLAHAASCSTRRAFKSRVASGRISACLSCSAGNAPAVSGDDSAGFATQTHASTAYGWHERSVVCMAAGQGWIPTAG
eukprot:scaffold16451_cov40-Tisochrysis_lutea.AAC.2